MPLYLTSLDWFCNTNFSYIVDDNDKIIKMFAETCSELTQDIGRFVKDSLGQFNFIKAYHCKPLRSQLFCPFKDNDCIQTDPDQYFKCITDKLCFKPDNISCEPH